MLNNYISEYLTTSKKAKNELNINNKPNKQQQNEKENIKFSQNNKTIKFSQLSKTQKKNFKKQFEQSQTLIKVINFEFKTLDKNHKIKFEKDVENCRKDFNDLLNIKSKISHRKTKKTNLKEENNKNSDDENFNDKNGNENNKNVKFSNLAKFKNSSKNEYSRLESINDDLCDIESRGTEVFNDFRQNTDILKRINLNTNTLNGVIENAQTLLKSIICREGVFSSVWLIVIFIFLIFLLLATYRRYY